MKFITKKSQRYEDSYFVELAEHEMRELLTSDQIKRVDNNLLRVGEDVSTSEQIAINANSHHLARLAKASAKASAELLKLTNPVVKPE